MAQNITLMGASYTDVPAVELPKTGGGTASFTDVTDTTATASDVASGKYFYTSSGVKTQGTASGGGNIGGLAQMDDVSTLDNPWAYMLSQMKNGNTVGGKITVTSSLPNTEKRILQTGLTTLHGILFVCKTYDVTTNVGTGDTNKWVFIAFYSGTGYQIIGQSWNNNCAYMGTRTNGSAYNSRPVNGTLRIDGGDIYYTARYNKNASYQILANNKEYEWLAW